MLNTDDDLHYVSSLFTLVTGVIHPVSSSAPPITGENCATLPTVQPLLYIDILIDSIYIDREYIDIDIECGRVSLSE